MKFYLSFVTQEDTHRKIPLTKPIVINANTLSPSLVWQFLSWKADLMQDTAINPLSDEWTSEMKTPPPCLYSLMKYQQALAEAAHQDTTLHQPWRKIYSENKNQQLQLTDRASLRKVVLLILPTPKNITILLTSCQL